MCNSSCGSRNRQRKDAKSLFCIFTLLRCTTGSLPTIKYVALTVLNDCASGVGECSTIWTYITRAELDEKGTEIYVTARVFRNNVSNHPCFQYPSQQQYKARLVINDRNAAHDLQADLSPPFDLKSQ